MFDKLPVISKETITQLENQISIAVKEGTVVDLARNISSNCRTKNPLLYEFLSDSLQKFVSGVATAYTLSEVATSKMFADLLLLYLVDLELSRRSEWNDKIGKYLEDIDFGDRKKE